MPKKTVEQEINEFLERWDCKQMVAFMHDVIPLMELYNVDEEEDWVKDIVGDEDLRNVRLIRTVYLVSKIAEKHSGMLCMLKIQHKNLHSRMQKQIMTENVLSSP